MLILMRRCTTSRHFEIVRHCRSIPKSAHDVASDEEGLCDRNFSLCEGLTLCFSNHCRTNSALRMLSATLAAIRCGMSP